MAEQTKPKNENEKNVLEFNTRNNHKFLSTIHTASCVPLFNLPSNQIRHNKLKITVRGKEKVRQKKNINAQFVSSY